MNFYDILFARKLAGGGGDIPPHSYQLKNIENTPTDIATFNASALPMPSLTVGIEAVQAGNGDPSPTNVRPISGWSAVNVYRSGKNLLNPSDNSLIQYNQDGNTRYGVIFSKSGTYNVGASATNNGIVFAKKVTNGVYGDSVYISTSSAYYPNNLFTITDNDLLLVYTSAPDKATATSWLENSKTQVELKQATTYEAYNGQTYTTALKDENDQPLTCYGGQLENVNGVQRLTLTHGYIASYNGETLPSTWISDRDVYAEGTTPTTGAEVVYELATPQQIPQQSQAISTQDGTNNLWADSGDINEGSYFVAI
jgi:hypothetical protein